MQGIGEKIMGVIAAMTALAVLAIVISSRANSVNVLSAFFGGLSNLIGVAISPVTGQSVSGLNATGLQGFTTGANSGGFAISGAATGNNGGVAFGVSGLNLNSLGSLFGGGGSSGGAGIGSSSFGDAAGGGAGLAGNDVASLSTLEDVSAFL